MREAPGTCVILGCNSVELSLGSGFPARYVVIHLHASNAVLYSIPVKYICPERDRELCPFVALFCRANRAERCRLSGVDPPTYARCESSHFDPYPTSTGRTVEFWRRKVRMCLASVSQKSWA